MIPVETPGAFGDIDPELEQDFAAVLPPGRRRPPVDAAPSKAPSPRPRKKAPARAAQSASEPPSPAATPDDTPEGSSSAPGGRSVAPRSPQAPRRGRPPVSTSDRLVLLAPAAVRSRMKATREETGKVYRDQVLDALEASVDQLDDLIGALNRPAVTQGKLFERVADRAPAVAPVQDRRQMTIPGFTVSQLGVIDALVESTGATSRSQLISTALEWHASRS